jgi:hypothetical protein
MFEAGIGRKGRFNRWFKTGLVAALQDKVGLLLGAGKDLDCGLIKSIPCASTINHRDNSSQMFLICMKNAVTSPIDSFITVKEPIEKIGVVLVVFT